MCVKYFPTNFAYTSRNGGKVYRETTRLLLIGVGLPVASANRDALRGAAGRRIAALAESARYQATNEIRIRYVLRLTPISSAR